MKKILFILFILSAATASTKAQGEDLPYHIQWGQELKEPKSTFLSKILTSNTQHFYALREKTSKVPGEGPPKIYIEKYNKQMNLLKSKALEMKFNGKKMELEDVMVLNRNLYLISSFNNIGKKKNYLFAQKINLKRLTPEKKIIKIGEIDTKNKIKEGFFNFDISKDSSKVLVYSEPPYKKKNPEKFNLSVYDQEFQEVWSKEFVLPYTDKGFVVEEYRVDNQGNVYLLALVSPDGKQKRKKGRPNYHYSILAYTNSGESMQEYSISLDEKFITDLTFRIDGNGKIVCSGFYSDKGTTSIRGTYFFRLDPKSGEMQDKNAKDFDFNFLIADVSERKIAKYMDAERSGKKDKQAELERYALDHLILRNDGGALLVAEQYFVREYVDRYDPYWGGFNNANNFGNSYEYYYNYNDIIVVNIRPNGEIQWTARIPKQQSTVNDGGYFSSYAMSIVRDKIYFIYNDNERNFTADDNRLYDFDRRRSVIALSQLSTDGSIRTYPIFSSQGANVITRPKVCRQTGRREMVIYGENGKKFKFANLQFL